MKNGSSLIRKAVKALLRRVGLYDLFCATLNAQKSKTKNFRKIKRFKTVFNGVAVEFSTEDAYSNSWFFPRYAKQGVHEKNVTEMLVEELREAKCFVDIGTNLGWYTCLAAKHMPRGVVYGFEMDDLNFALLRKNLALNHCDNVEAYNMAVSDAAGVVSYKRDRDNPSPVFRMQPSAQDSNSTQLVSVESLAVDDFLESKHVIPDVVKVDVEGAEMNVLMGMRRTLAKCRPTLFLELHPYKLSVFGTSTAEILSLLSEHGYRICEIASMRAQDAHRSLRPLQKDSVIESNTMLYATVAK